MAEIIFADPLCCGEPMVHNSATGQYECADAFFTLLDEGYMGEGGWRPLEILRPGDVRREHRPVLSHWRESRIPDGWDEDRPLPPTPVYGHQEERTDGTTVA